jgi:hypothetical protein
LAVVWAPGLVLMGYLLLPGAWNLIRKIEARSVR